MHRQVNEDEDDQIFCDEDSSPALVVSKVLTLQHQQEEDKRCHIFHTKAGINGRAVKVIIDGGSCHNFASEELCSKCDVVPMSICHLLLGRPWQFDCGVIHNGRTNHYSFKMKGKEYVL